MYGHFNIIIKSFVCKRFGESSWEIILARCEWEQDFKDTELYSEATTEELLDTAVNVLALDREQLLFLLGEHYVEQLRARHDELLRNLGDTMLAFLQNLDYLHTAVRCDYPDMRMPSFRCESDSQPDHMIVHYYSARPGFSPLIEGMLYSIAQLFFKSDILVTILSRTMEAVSERGPARHHVVFSLRLTKMRLPSETPPTLIAQTQKGIEKQILKTDIDRVLMRLCEIRETQGDEALPLSRGKVVRAKWRSFAKMSVLRSGFVPQYPMSLTFNAKSFCDIFPYHVVFNESLIIVHSGAKIQEMMPDIRSLHAHLTDFLVLLHPGSMDMTFDNVSRFINTPFIFHTHPGRMNSTWGSRPMVSFKGQMVAADGDEHLIYLCSPHVRSLQDLEQRNMKLADIPIHDVTRDMIWLQLITRMRVNHGGGGGGGVEEPQRHHTTTTTVVVGISDSVAPPAEDLGTSDPAVLRRLVLEARRDLIAERRQREAAARGFLPPAYLRGLQEGLPHQAGQYESATVLFCDVVGFAQILQHCSPTNTVRLLTDLHRKFNLLCQVHATFRVEAIGDAYMVVAGAPDQMESHPQRMANTALGMLIAASETRSPCDSREETGTHIQIRIGLCTGAVTCGVVGDVTPRCLVFGYAVNMASRLESHGVAGRVHTNLQTRDLLSRRGFRLLKRGAIDLRGIGRQKTFFLETNVTCSENEIMGRRRRSRGRAANGVSVTFINDGRYEHPGTSLGTGSSNSPLLSSNKVSPTSAGELNVRSSPATDGDSLVLMSYPDRP